RAPPMPCPRRWKARHADRTGRTSGSLHFSSCRLRASADNRIIITYIVSYHGTKSGAILMALRDSAQSGEPVLGMFVKTTSPQIIELLACTTLDFIVLDAEHAPFGREALSQCLAIAHL